MKELKPRRLRREARRRLLGIAAVVIVYSALTAGLYRMMAAHAQTDSPVIRVTAAGIPPMRDVVLKGGRFLVEGHPFVIKSVGWDPVRPGELPWRRSFVPSELEDDLERIRAAGFNTVRTWAALSPEELVLVGKHRLRVLQGIWVESGGDFASARFRRQTLAQVTRAVEASRWSPAILGYLVMNEPRARAVAHAGIGESRAFLREVVATVRALDPSAPIGYASWPGMEALDDSLLDFVAFNIYSHRPRVVMDEFGIRNYVRMLRETIAGGRPMLISEFGVSVSPGRPLRTPGHGGATELEQAAQLCALESDFLAEGVAGTSVFQWSDGWWKNDSVSADELAHDPMDPEEWFGLVGFQSLSDRRGTPRPALGALRDFQQVLLIEPRDGAVSGQALPISLYGDSRVHIRLQVDDAPAKDVVLRSEPGGWLTGWVAMPPRGAHALRFEIVEEGTGYRRFEHRVIQVGSDYAHLSLTASTPQVRPGQPYALALRCSGPGSADASVLVSAFSEDRPGEDRVLVHTDAKGQARVQLQAPPDPTIITIVAFYANRSTALRSGAWAAVESRRNP